MCAQRGMNFYASVCPCVYTGQCWHCIVDASSIYMRWRHNEQLKVNIDNTYPKINFHIIHLFYLFDG